MGSVIMVYVFDLDENDEDEEEGQNEDGWVEDCELELLMGMVFMVDMMNVDVEFNVYVNYEEDVLVVIVLWLIKKGEEIFNYYGFYLNLEFFRCYGYVIQKYFWYDVVEIFW